jgi:hypothetical protein
MVESITVITLLLSALDRIDYLPAIFDQDPYESRRRALPGTRLLKVLVVYQMIHTTKLRGLIRTLTEHPGLQKALGGTVALNTLSNGLAQRDVGQMVEAWMAVVQTYGPWLERMGRKFARIAVVDASLISQAERGGQDACRLGMGPWDPPATGGYDRQGARPERRGDLAVGPALDLHL